MFLCPAHTWDRGALCLLDSLSLELRGRSDEVEEFLRRGAFSGKGEEYVSLSLFSTPVLHILFMRDSHF